MAITVAGLAVSPWLLSGARSSRRCRWASCSDNGSVEYDEASGPHRGELDTALAGRGDRALGDRATDPRRQQRRLRSEADLDRIAAASTVNQVDQKTYWVLAKS